MRAALILVLGLVAPSGGGHDLIDRRLSERWQAAGLRPAPIADDYEFLRRLSLDLRGVIPSPEEVRAFARDSDPAKREKIIDVWLRSESFALMWADRWTEDLVVQPLLKAKLRDQFDRLRGWLRDALLTNMPYDRFARRLLTAKGPMDLDPAAAFLNAALINNVEGQKDLTERTARLFLGMQIRCAECHDHPFDDWTREDFYAMVSFFWQTRPSGGIISDDPALGDPVIGEVKVDKDKKAPPVKLPYITPRYKSKGGTPEEGESRRVAFARFLAADRQFARAAVNRYWGILVGRGMIHPLDGFTATRKPSHPELLEELAEEFVRSKFDLRGLLKSILLSKAYQLSSRAASSDLPSENLFARAITSPLSPEQLFESLVAATGVNDSAVQGKSKDPKRAGGAREAFFQAIRPVQANEAAPANPEATITEALLFMNGDLVNAACSADAKLRLGRLLEREADPGRRIEELFLATLSRPPAPREVSALLERVRNGGTKAYEDLLWALINSTEFVTRH